MWFLALKQLRSRLSQTVLTFIGITLGAAAYITFAGMMGGYQQYMIDKLINNDAHVRISPRDEFITKETFAGIFFPESDIKWINPPSGRIEYTHLSSVPTWFKKLDRDPRVVAYSPQIIRDVIYTSKKFSIPGRFIGMDPNRETRVTTIARYVTAGNFSDVSKGISLIIVGDELMKKLGARVNDTIDIVTATGTAAPVKIVGTIRTGMRMIDERYGYSSLASVQSITGSSGEITDIAIRLKDVNMARAVATELAGDSTDRVESWDQANESILFVFRTQNIVRNSTTLTIILVVAFGIYNVLNMSVNHRKKEIAILRSMGYGQQDIILLFLYQGLILGFLGSLFGMLLGWAGCSYIESIPIAVSGSRRGWVSASHMLISWDVMIYVNAFVLVTLSSVVASFIPARSAGRLSPLEIIRGAG
ncbi:MAG: permease [Spirochaetes bacterium RBG_13_51_14]|nr:MAG: permease [Spirochaetes bacterium RBG_13_51_14]